MKFGSVCSGIEAASAAWEPLGWKSAFFSEIEKFPCSVLAHHYPDTPNFGDMTKFKEWPDAIINVLVGGTPCQSFSVAGLRKGLDDPRGNLMLTFGAIAAKYRPKWLVWENVPGVLSSNGGRDFGTFLGMLAELGYGFAYRVLDAQYFGVAQRRRRVFVVAHLGDWRAAAAVLFERHSLSGDLAPSREAGQSTAHDVAPSLVGSGRGVERAGETRGQDPVVAAYRMAAFGEYSNDGSASAMKARDYKDATDLVVQPVPYRITFCDANGRRQDRPNGGLYISQPDIAGTLTSAESDLKILQPIAFPERLSATQCASAQNICPSLGALNPMAVTFPINTQMALRGAEISNTSREGVGLGDLHDPAFTLQAAHHHAVAFVQNSRDEVRLMGGDGSIVGALAADTGAKQQCYVAQSAVGFNGDTTPKSMFEITPCMRAEQGGEGFGVAHNMQVRRLTPIECERLQGFPDNYTQIPHRGKPAADGPRYKALGNSMAVPVMAWIGKRIQMVQEIVQ
jgi:DNA (cytosine-5)-methyltransferase 1